MILHDCIYLNNPLKWTEVLRNIKHSFFHTWDSCYAMHLTTGFKTYLYHFETESAQILCPIHERELNGYIDITTPYGFGGFVGNGYCHNFSHFWQEFVKSKNYICGYIGLNPIFDDYTYFQQYEYLFSNQTYCIDLGSDSEVIFSRLSQNRKRQIKEWEKNLSVVKLEKELLVNFFLNIYPEFMKTRNASKVYSFSQETLSFLLSLENIFMVGAGTGSEVEAVSLFAYTPYVGDFLFNVSLPEGKNYSTGLIWQAIKYLKSLQIPLLNLGGGVRENDNLAQFKERFGANKLPLGCLKQVYQPEIYEELCKGANANPNDMTGYFPAYRKP